MKVLLINSLSGKGSTGRIVDSIANLLIAKGHKASICYGLGHSNNQNAFKFGSKVEQYIHKVLSHAFDMQGLGSLIATRKLIKYIKKFEPDIINLHNIHGNYLNYPLLFKFLSSTNIEVVWTLHDCWSFTGHCPHFAFCGCEKWRTECHSCPQLWMYPKSDFWDGSKRNFRLKRKYFQLFPDRLHVISVSNWLKNLAGESILNKCSFNVFNNGIDINVFNNNFSAEEILSIKHKYKLPKNNIILAVASPWNKRKGLDDLIQLNNKIDHSKFSIVIVGLNEEQLHSLPSDIKGILRTGNAIELAKLYNCAKVFVNPTYEDSFPTVNLESLACGTPVITYNTGGSPEAISEETGIVIKQGKIDEFVSAIDTIVQSTDKYTSEQCRGSAIYRFNQDDSYLRYVEFFENLRQK